ncbi:unnamed protein product, partial [Sphacelaria rigidula]
QVASFDAHTDARFWMLRSSRWDVDPLHAPPVLQQMLRRICVVLHLRHPVPVRSGSFSSGKDAGHQHAGVEEDMLGTRYSTVF